MNDLTEEDLRRRREDAQRVQRHTGEPSRREDIDSLKNQIEELRSERRAMYGTGGITVNGGVISASEQKRGTPARTTRFRVWRGGVIVGQNVFVSSGPSTTLF